MPPYIPIAVSCGSGRSGRGCCCSSRLCISVGGISTLQEKRELTLQIPVHQQKAKLTHTTRRGRVSNCISSHVTSITTESPSNPSMFYPSVGLGRTLNQSLSRQFSERHKPKEISYGHSCGKLQLVLRRGKPGQKRAKFGCCTPICPSARVGGSCLRREVWAVGKGT